MIGRSSGLRPGGMGANGVPCDHFPCRRKNMSMMSLRLPESLHRKVRELAAKESISINQFIATAVAEKCPPY